MPVRRFNLVFTAQKTGNGSGLGGRFHYHQLHPAVSVGAPTLRRGRFLILILLAVIVVAVAITRIILKQFQIAKIINGK